jgi:putative endonuclease
MEKIFSVYILTNKRNGTLYVGVTSKLKQRIWQHKHKLVDGFTKKYNLHILVYYETTPNSYSAIAREKQLKKWRREKKIFLIEKMNPQWKDLYEDIV